MNTLPFYGTSLLRCVYTDNGTNNNRKYIKLQEENAENDKNLQMLRVLYKLDVISDLR